MIRVNCRQHRTIRWMMASALCFLAVQSTTLAQCTNSINGYCPETSPRRGEKRLTAHQYKASHNSYERNEQLDDQIDDYNDWMVELDCFWDDGGVSVEHFCGSIHNAQSLGTELAELATNSTGKERFTVILMELKDPTDASLCYDDWPAQSTYRDYIQGKVEEKLGADRIYTPDEFIDVDSSKWPSYQELARRGHNYAIVLSEYGAGGQGYSDFFFNLTTTNPPYDSLYSNIVLVNADWGCDIGHDGALDPDWSDDDPDYSSTSNPDRWLFRAYPGGACDICSEQNNGYWNSAVNHGFHFIATNCVDNDHTFDPDVHSPAPYYVNGSGNYDHNWGTKAFPKVGLQGLYDATREVSPMVVVKVEPATWYLSKLDDFINNNNKINRAMELRCNGTGSVVIR